MRNSNKLFFIILIQLIISTVARADAIVPALQFFSPFLAIPSLILLTVIIIVEAAVLKLFIRQVRFHKHLFYSTLINIVSSIAGSLLGFINYSAVFSDFFWSSTFVTLALPFIITFASELPVLFCLYKKYIPQKKTLGVNLVMNIASYVVFIILITPVFLTGIMKMSEYLDNKRLKQWSHIEILKNETGNIYALKRNLREKEYTFKQKEYELRKFNLAAQTWTSTKQLKTAGYGDFFPSSAWDISLTFCAFPIDSNSVTILKKANFTEHSQIPVGCNGIKISDSEELIAVLEPIGEIEVHKKGKDWFQVLGEKSKLRIFEIASGNQVSECNENILGDGLDWSSNSKHLLITGLRSSDVKKLEFKHAQRDYGYARSEFYFSDFCPKVIYLFDIDTKVTSEICEGIYPHWRPGGNEFLFIKDNKVFLYELASKQSRLICEAYGCHEFVWSPSGQNILGCIRTQNPMWTEKYFLIVINIQNPELKYMTTYTEFGNGYYGLRWRPE